MRNLQQSETETRKRKDVGRGGRSHRESTWWSLYFMSMFVIIVLFFFFNIYRVCIFLPTEERVNKLREKAKWVHECERNREKSPYKMFCPPFFLLLFKERQFIIPQGVKTAHLVIVRAVVREIMIVWQMADRYCYQSFFLKNFSYILLLLSL